MIVVNGDIVGVDGKRRRDCTRFKLHHLPSTVVAVLVYIAGDDDGWWWFKLTLTQQ